MELIVEDKAVKWFEEEVGRAEGAGIRFKTMIYGSSPVQDSFALQVEPTEPHSPIVTFTSDNGLLFFIEKLNPSARKVRMQIDHKIQPHQPSSVYATESKGVIHKLNMKYS